MRLKRIIALGSGIALAGAALSLGPSRAADLPGVGSSKVGTTVLSVELGDSGKLLGLRLLADEAIATIDPKNGASEGMVRLSPFAVSSGAVDALNIAPRPTEVRSPGAAKSATPSKVSFGDHGVPAAVATGAITPAALSAGVDASGAHSSLGASVDGLSLAGGLISVGNLAAQLGANAGPTGADGTRSVTVKDVRVLDLSALLAGLNLNVSQLPLDVVSKITENLKIPVAGVDAGKTVTETVTGITKTIGDLTTVVGGKLPTGISTSNLTLPGVSVPTGTVSPPSVTAPTPTAPAPTAPTPTAPSVDSPLSAPVADTTSGLVGTVENQLNTTVNAVLPLTQPVTALLPGVEKILAQYGLPISATTQDLLKTIAALKAGLTGVLTSSLKALDAAPLLSVQDLTISISTKAGKTVEASASEIKATVGAVKVGELAPVGGVDLVGKVGEVTSTLNGLLGTTLGSIHPGLASLVSVSVLDQTKNVTSVGGYNKAAASITALTATIKPPAAIATILDQLRATNGVGDVLNTVDSTTRTVVGELDKTMGTLTGLLGGTPVGTLRKAAVTDALAALTQGATIRIGQVTSSSEFLPATAGTSSTPQQSVNAPAPAGPTSGTPAITAAPGEPGGPAELPRTGGEIWMLLAVAALLVALGLGAPQWAEAAARRVRQ